MASEPVTWKREDHTAAKHELLRAFFVKWVSIHSGYFTRAGGGLVRVYDGFAGPGIYVDGEPGSPRILLEELIDNQNLLTRWTAVRYEFTFVEQDTRRAQMLEGILNDAERDRRAQGQWTDQISWSVTAGRYEEHTPQPVAERNSALFLFLDPFGYSHAPMTLTSRLVQQPKSDTLIFLTKRHDRLAELSDGWDWPPNVWMGVTIENRRFVHRAGALRTVPAAVRFISAEPLLGPLEGLDLNGIDWLIVGGESGPRHRRVDPSWIRALRDACVRDGVAFFFKQWGGHRPKSNGREFDGRQWDEYPKRATRSASHRLASPKPESR